MPNYTILVPADLPESCFLLEALYWRAFGRVPVEIPGEEGPWRESTDIYEGDDAPFPDNEELSDAECRYAGIPADPRMQALLTDRPSFEVEHYEKMIGIMRTFDPPEPEKLDECIQELAEAKRYHAEVSDWMPLLEDYVDEFKAEICLDLRRGKLEAFGRKLPDPSPDKSYAILNDQDRWFDTLENAPVPKAAWLTRDVNWSGSGILGSNVSYIWIQVRVDQLLQLYPPDQLIKPDQCFPIGSSVAVSGIGARANVSPSRRGRPSLPWDDFHVEIARMFRDGDMPTKKEAAIASLQEWFAKQHGKPASRAAIGQRLRPYCDQLMRKDRN